MNNSLSVSAHFPLYEEKTHQQNCCVLPQNYPKDLVKVCKYV